jgi:hypothetical protein
VTWLVAAIAVPIMIELFGRLIAIRDVWPVSELRPRAFQRLALPAALIGLVLWIFPETAWRGLVYGAIFVIAWRWLTLAIVRIVMRVPAFHTRSIDLE